MGLGLVLCGALTLSGCGPASVKEDTAETTTALSTEDISKLLTEAESTVGEERAALLLEASASMYLTDELDWARNTLATLFASGLNDRHYFTYSLLSAQVALAEGEHFVSKRYLWQPRFIDILATIEPERQIIARELRANLLCDLAEFRDCVAERLAIDAVFERHNLAQQEARDLNQDLIWLALMELPHQDLQMEAQMQSNPLEQGWYTLAALSKNNQTNMRLQLQSVEDWALRWPEHPASLRLPADLQLLKQLVEEQATQVAVLLPTSGKLAKPSQAIRDGLMAAFYRLSESDDQVPNLRFYDTNDRDINILYDQAILEGAQAVIGPLDKAQIDELALREQLPVPTLALNYAENPVGITAQLFQFGLGVEDEASQVAERAWRDGHRRAMILAPASSWGDRAAATFTASWEANGGRLVGDFRFKGIGNYSNLVRDAMSVEASQQRARRIRQILGQKVESEPRPRKDVDLIFLVAHPTQARQIKPILAFHYAGQIPVYSTSHIYNGEIDSNADRDMNGIRFATLPWFFNAQLPEKQSIDSFANGASSYQPLYALGVDAFQLYPRLRQLVQVRNAHYYGNTGKLSLDDQQRVIREQTWAQFIRGRAYPMPTVLSADDT